MDYDSTYRDLYNIVIENLHEVIEDRFFIEPDNSVGEYKFFILGKNWSKSIFSDRDLVNKEFMTRIKIIRRGRLKNRASYKCAKALLN
jgi:hypothetical protein